MEPFGITITLLAILWAAYQTYQLWNLRITNSELQHENNKLITHAQNQAAKQIVDNITHERDEMQLAQTLTSKKQGPKPAPLPICGAPFVTYIFRPMWDKDIERLTLFDGMKALNVDCPKCGVISIVCTHFPNLHGRGNCVGCGATIKAYHGVLSLED